MRPQRPTSAPHGTVARYTSGCSCFECCEAYRAYQNHRNSEIRAGRPPLVDVGPARTRLHELYAAGYGRRAIAEATGVPYGTIRIIDGSQPVQRGTGGATTQTRKVKRDHAEAILGLETVLPGRHTALIPAEPTRQMLRRLTKHVSRKQIARSVGMSATAIGDIMARKGNPHRTERIQAKHALAILEYAEQSGFTRKQEEAALRLLPDTFDRIVETNGWEYDALLEAAGVSKDAYQQIRAGRAVGEERAERIAIALGASVDRLFEAVA